jgi:hypothetical protein
MVTKHNVVTSMLSRMRRAYCGLHGHDSLLQFQQERMFLQCTSCGYETPGWELADTPPVVTTHAHIRPARLVRPHLVGARRVA